MGRISQEGGPSALSSFQQEEKRGEGRYFFYWNAFMWCKGFKLRYCFLNQNVERLHLQFFFFGESYLIDGNGVASRLFLEFFQTR